MKKTFTFLLILISTISIAQETVLLRLNLKEGDKYIMKMDMFQDMGEIMKMNMKMDFPLEITSAKNDVYHIEMGISKVISNIEQAGMKINYDSSKKEEEMTIVEQGMHAKMKDLLTFLVDMEMNNRSEVIATKLVKGSGDPDQITGNSTFTEYPKEAVKIGYTWSQEKTSNGIKTNYKYTVKSIEKDIINLDLDGTVTEGAAGTVIGNLIVDRKSGMVNKQILEMNLEASGQKIASTITINTTKL